MAIRTDASTEVYTRTTGLPGTSWSMMGWFQIVSDRNTFSAFLSYAGTGTSEKTLETTVSGTILMLYNGSAQTGGNGTDLAVGTWYHLAMTYNSTAQLAYVNGVLNISGTPAAGVPGNTLRICGSPTSGEWLNGRVAAVKIYDGAVLTAAEIAQEMWTYRPQRTANLNSWYPFFSTSDDEIDFSGNGRTLTAPTGVTVEDGPPICW